MKKLGEDMWRDAMNIKKNALKLTWYMRGGIQFTDILNMSADEFKFINELVDENLETTKKTKMPFF